MLNSLKTNEREMSVTPLTQPKKRKWGPKFTEMTFSELRTWSNQSVRERKQVEDFLLTTFGSYLVELDDYDQSVVPFVLHSLPINQPEPEVINDALKSFWGSLNPADICSQEKNRRNITMGE